MDSYLPFVASAWGASALVLAALTADSLARARRWRRAAERRETHTGDEAA